MSFYDGEGELNGMAILTDATVREIKALYLTGKHSYEDLAKWFGVTQGTRRLRSLKNVFGNWS